MANFILGDDQNVDVAVSFKDDAGNVVAGSTLDAGSMTATFDDGSEVTATIAPDQSSVNVRANGKLSTGDTLRVNATAGGVAVPNPGVFAFEVDTTGANTIVLTPGVAQHN